ncbi:glycoside hydrolase family 16 protein [Pseudalkalibacillus sp. Hm43]|uniref:glycoside hydrolase family 16 protein n=1 Tax=Pseudalkalibacillus sp. Hm43 TaxID=3450742 RepID=UPI003F41BF8E
MKKAFQILLILLLIVFSLAIYVNVPALKWLGDNYLDITSNNETVFATDLVSKSSVSQNLTPQHSRIQDPIYYDEANKDWELVWHDEFDQAQLHRGKWVKEDWVAEKNNELQYYSPENVQLKNGFLQLVSREENEKGRHFTSGAIHTRDRFSFLYGKVEMRAKLPYGKGIFPAFWMLPNRHDVWLPEIDIMEMLGDKPDETWMVLHWTDKEGKLATEYKSHLGPDYSKGFHTFGIEWTPSKIVWFIDGVERFQTDKYVPQEEMYLYVNTAVGGDWPGSPDDTTVFPQYFEVDYIRVYQQTGEGL